MHLVIKLEQNVCCKQNLPFLQTILRNAFKNEASQIPNTGTALMTHAEAISAYNYDFFQILTKITVNNLNVLIVVVMIFQNFVASYILWIYRHFSKIRSKCGLLEPNMKTPLSTNITCVVTNFSRIWILLFKIMVEILLCRNDRWKLKLSLFENQTNAKLLLQNKTAISADTFRKYGSKCSLSCDKIWKLPENYSCDMIL